MAYSIGATEARAAHCLLKQVPPAVVQKLCALVKPGLCNDVVACLSAGAVSKLVLAFSPVSVCVSARRFTMAKFVTHESIAAGYFNSDYVGSATAVSAMWADILINNEAVLELLVERLARHATEESPTLEPPRSGPGSSWVRFCVQVTRMCLARGSAGARTPCSVAAPSLRRREACFARTTRQPSWKHKSQSCCQGVPA